MIYAVLDYDTDALIGHGHAFAAAIMLDPGTQFGRGESLAEAIENARLAALRWRTARSLFPDQCAAFQIPASRAPRPVHNAGTKT